MAWIINLIKGDTCIRGQFRVISMHGMVEMSGKCHGNVLLGWGRENLLEYFRMVMSFWRAKFSFSSRISSCALIRREEEVTFVLQS